MKKKIYKIIAILLAISSILMGMRAMYLFNRNREVIASEDLPKESTPDIKKDNFKKKNYFLTDDIKSLFNAYPDFAKIVESSSIKVPMYEDMVPQGLAVTDDYLFITAYDGTKTKKSKCFVMDHSSLPHHTVTLDVKSHVGGIVYDAKNELLWLPDENGTLNAYDLYDMIDNKTVNAAYRFERIVDYPIDYISIDDEYIFVGSFKENTSGFTTKFEIVKNAHGIELKATGIFKVPSQVQGITFFKQNGTKYILLSRSYGRHKPSYLEMYEYDEKIADYTTNDIKKLSFKLPPMLEQITTFDEKLYALFESNAKKYSNCNAKVERVCIFDYRKIVSNW